MPSADMQQQDHIDSVHKSCPLNNESEMLVRPKDS